MTLIAIAGLGFLLALFPSLLYLQNRRYYVPAIRTNAVLTAVSVLIPARNEALAIGAAVESVLGSVGVTLEVVVLDDHSEDATATVVLEIAQRDARVRLESSQALPLGWCGKQHACFQLSKLARYDLFAFMDADVRLAPDGLAKMVDFVIQSDAELVSGFPRQETDTFLEKLLIPLIHFLLLGFLPLQRMRNSLEPSFGAGCGQLFLARRAAYETVGGHSAVRFSLHDGLTLPRAFRKCGQRTDLTDATAVARCRMYRSAREVWLGLAKNAREGLASNRLIVPVTILLILGQVVPFLATTLGLVGYFAPEKTEVLLDRGQSIWLLILGIAGIFASYYPRFDAAIRFRQSWLGALLHPVGIVVLLAIQWYALCRAIVGKPVGWKGRAHPSQS